jgi:signal transduction histidine kinase
MKSEVRDERRKIMAKLIQTNRMTSLGLLVSGAAHEINTPNGAIRLAGQKFSRVWNDATLILDRVSVDEGNFVLGGITYNHARVEVSNSLELINRCTGRIDQVLKDLRGYSLGEQSQVLENIDINLVVNDALSIISSHRQMENISVDRSLSDGISPVMGNRYKLGQVMTNLLLNAMQSIPVGSGGLITINTGVDGKTGEVIVTVKDNGEGIPEDISGKLMEPFFSTRMEKGGSGLGLYISNYIISEHNGSLTFESSVEKGTVFTVRLPAAN